MTYKHTERACFTGYIVQAVVNNFVPLLFLTFQKQFGIPLSQVTLLITLNFLLQLAVDGASVFFIDRIGYRASALLAHGFAALGRIFLAVLPSVLPSAFAGLLISVLFYAVGGGLLEVIISPIVEACPSEHKAKTMSLLHSGMFWVIMLMMVCAGASEQAVSQWASTFAEKGLGVSKALGDLTGPTVFSLLMGLSRLIYGKRGDKMDLTKTMLGCCGLCVAAYLLIGLTQSPLTGLIGVGLCGFSVGIFWPGTFSTASASMHRGGTALFALMALAGDLGCSAGPTVAGAVASALGDNLRAGILCGLGFPLLMIVGVLLMKRMADRAKPRA